MFVIQSEPDVVVMGDNPFNRVSQECYVVALGWQKIVPAETHVTVEEPGVVFAFITHGNQFGSGLLGVARVYIKPGIGREIILENIVDCGPCRFGYMQKNEGVLIHLYLKVINARSAN
jgi:hypothetical protein